MSISVAPTRPGDPGEVSLELEIARLRREAWLAENREALDSSNAFTEANGLPVAADLQF